MKDTTDRTQHPPLLRFLLWIGRPFGVVFVPELNVRVIYRMGQYAGAKGPGNWGLIHYDTFTETLGPLVYIGGQKKEYAFSGLISRDGLPFTLRLSILFSYDPCSAPEVAPMLTRLPHETIAELTKTYIEWALLAAVNKYEATQLTQHEVRAKVEADVKDKLTEEMAFLGIQTRGEHSVHILRVEPPPSLTERHEIIAQRRASVLAGTEFHPAEFRRALVSEFVEHLARTGAGESIINFNDLLQSYVAEHKMGAQPQRIIENPPQSTLHKEDDTSKPAPPRPKSRL